MIMISALSRDVIREIIEWYFLWWCLLHITNQSVICEFTSLLTSLFCPPVSKQEGRRNLLVFVYWPLMTNYFNSSFFFFIVITHSTLWRIGCFRRIPLTSQLVSGRLSHHHNRHRYPPFIHHRYHYLSLSFLLFLRILSTSSRTKWGRFSQDSFADTESGGRD